MFGVSDEEDALDGGEGGTGQFGECVYCCGGALGVAFEDEAFLWATGEGGFDVVDDLLELE